MVVRSFVPECLPSEDHALEIEPVADDLVARLLGHLPHQVLGHAHLWVYDLPAADTESESLAKLIGSAQVLLPVRVFQRHHTTEDLHMGLLDAAPSRRSPSMTMRMLSTMPISHKCATVWPAEQSTSAFSMLILVLRAPLAS
jgi:hypothetical protein